MHFGDKEQLEKSKLVFTLYKHEVLGKPLTRNRKGFVKNDCVHYSITAIKEAKFISPYLILNLYKKSYKHLSPLFDNLKNETWYEIELNNVDDWGITKDNIVNIIDRTNDIDDIHRLH